jgi:hypothetical protein
MVTQRLVCDHFRKTPLIEGAGVELWKLVQRMQGVWTERETRRLIAADVDGALVDPIIEPMGWELQRRGTL